jgi:NAD-dependent DNA ligase
MCLSNSACATTRRSTKKLFAALDAAAVGVPLHRFIFALGIPQVGLNTAKLLASRYGSLDVFRAAAVGLYKLNSVYPFTRSFKAPGFNPCTLKCDLLVSIFAFKCNLYRYTAVAEAEAAAAAAAAAEAGLEAAEEETAEEETAAEEAAAEAMTGIDGIGPVVAATVGLYKLNAVDP